MRLKYEKVIHHAIVNNLFGFGYTKKSCNAQGSSKYYLFVTAPFSFFNNKKRTWQLAIVASSHYRRRYDA